MRSEQQSMTDLQQRGRINPEIQFPELKLTEAYVKGCPAGHMPFILQPLDQNQVAVFCFSNSNPFPPRSKFNRFLPSIADKCVGRGKRIALIRLFGWADAVSGSKVPNFRPDYFPKGHLLRHEDALARLAQKHTLYCGDDCATARSHAVLWKAVFAPGLDDRSEEIIVGESPTRGEGEWVDINGEAGDGQRLYREYTSKEYKTLLRTRELEEFGVKFDEKNWLDPVLRQGDPRGFANEQETSEGKLRFFEIYQQDDSAADPLRFPMTWRPASVARTIEKDMLALGKCADLLACDWDKPVDATNHPHQLISDRCENLIHCLVNWDGLASVAGKPNTPNPYKDFVDVWRYINDGQTPYLDLSVSNVTGGGGWG